MKIVETTVADYLKWAISFSGRTQSAIASDVGFGKANMISMMKSGTTRVPIDRILALAAATGTEPGPFLALAMREYMPATWNYLVAHPETLTRAEPGVREHRSESAGATLTR